MLYCSSECGSISIMHAQLRTIYCNTYVSTFYVCLCLLTFVCNSTYLIIEMLISNISKKHCSIYKKFKSMIQNNIMCKSPVTRCNFPGNLQRNSTVANFTVTKSRIALQVARKIATCDRAFIHVCLAYRFLHSGQVLSSFKCYFKRKYLNLIDSNCDVDESCPWLFIGTVLATGSKCIINIYI